MPSCETTLIACDAHCVQLFLETLVLVTLIIIRLAMHQTSSHSESNTSFLTFFCF